MNKLKQIWSKIPESWKKEATSFGHTFIGTLIVSIGLQLDSGAITWTKEAMVALMVAAIRSAWKAAFNKIVVKK